MPKSTEQCEKIRERMKEKILKESLAYFAVNGLSGAKVNDLAKHIGIGQGTLYSYFSSKEELFKSITQKIVSENEKGLNELYHAPISPKEKIVTLSKSLLNRIHNEMGIAESFALNVHMSMEYGLNNNYSEHYAKAPNTILAKIIEEGQKDCTIIEGNPDMLADFYWNVVHIIALKKVYGNVDELKPEDAQLIRILVKD